MNVRGGIEWDRKVSCTRGKSQSLKWYIFAYQGSLKGLNENKNGCKACDDKQVSRKTTFLKYISLAEIFQYLNVSVYNKLLTKNQP